jgi:hypothetical protein
MGFYPFTEGFYGLLISETTFYELGKKIENFQSYIGLKIKTTQQGTVRLVGIPSESVGKIDMTELENKFNTILSHLTTILY